MDITSRIPYGQENAVHLDELSHRLNISTATVKNIIQQARRQGTVILSGRSGYWLTDNENEKKIFLSHMDKQAKSRFVTTKTLRASLKENPAQQSFADI